MPESLLLSPDVLQAVSVYTHCYCSTINSIRTQFELQSCQSPSGSVVNALVFHAPGLRIDTHPGQIFFARFSFLEKVSDIADSATIAHALRAISLRA